MVNAICERHIEPGDPCIVCELEKRDAEIARLRAVLAWAAMILRLDRHGPGIVWRYMPDDLDSALRGDWDAVRAAGVALEEEE